MKELAQTKEVNPEQTRLKELSDRLNISGENISATKADQKLKERLDIGAPEDFTASEKLDKKTLTLKEEINDLLAEKFNTSPEFEELRSKSKLGRLSTWESAKYSYLSKKFPERAKISATERTLANLDYADAKKYKLDFQLVEALRFYRSENEPALGLGKLSPREQDLYEKLSDVYAKKILEDTDEAMARASALLY